MAVVKAVSSRASIARAIRYVTKTEKTEEKLVSGIGCAPETAIEEMKATKALWGKEEGRQYKHYIHSFPPSEKITPEQAHELAKELCQDRFKGYEVLIATHRDKEHIHSHIIVNSVSYEDGKKLQQSRADLARMKKDCIEQCRQHGLSVPVKGQEITSDKQTKYKALERGVKGEYKSYVLDCYKATSVARVEAKSRDEFIAMMKGLGWETRWTDSRKHITFKDQDGNKVRAANLEKTFKESFTKEELDRGFEKNADAAAVRARAEEQLHGHEPDSGINGKDCGTELEKLQATIGKSRAEISRDDSDRADRIADQQSRDRERDRSREREIERGIEESRGRER